jgi:hypothetical protein
VSGKAVMRVKAIEETAQLAPDSLAEATIKNVDLQ